MVHNPEKYQLATHYRKQGFSYTEIANLCGVSKSTVSNWFAKKAFSKRVKEDNARKAAVANKQRLALVSKARQSERVKRYTEAIKTAETEFGHYKHDPLFMSALLLYRAKGDLSSPSTIRFTSNDVVLHRVFMKFCRDYLGVQSTDIAFWLLLPENQTAATEERWWSAQLKFPMKQFGKTQRRAGSATQLHKGTGNTIIGSTVLKCKLNRWIELALKKW